MLAIVLLLLVTVPILELWLLLQVGGEVGAPATIGIVLLTGLVGAWLARREGLKAVTRVNASVQRGELPTRAMFDALAVFVGGALLLTPGFITDAMGLLLLLPPGRRLLLAGLGASWRRRLRRAGFQVQWDETFAGGSTQTDRAPSPRAPAVGRGPVIDATFETEKAPGDEPG